MLPATRPIEPVSASLSAWLIYNENRFQEDRHTDSLVCQIGSPCFKGSLVCVLTANGMAGSPIGDCVHHSPTHKMTESGSPLPPPGCGTFSSDLVAASVQVGYSSLKCGVCGPQLRKQTHCLRDGHTVTDRSFFRNRLQETPQTSRHQKGYSLRSALPYHLADLAQLWVSR
jgi:hypothetical protein